MSLIQKLKKSASRLKSDTLALYLAARDPRTPWLAKAVVAIVVAYALSPIDLIPDFIPVLGYLDDIILLPLGVALAIRLVPEAVMSDCRARALDAFKNGRPVSRWAGVAVVAIWMAAIVVLGVVGYRMWLEAGQGARH
ncbi:YkvA family protein [Marinobacter mangrovi]|uniref:YkvA family protein n=1 Tax=Marinobacter mangrovi TaxID=2803918 RepID=UPI0019317F25|nr:YkvA family protein [Marinobacter mangrovi]